MSALRLKRLLLASVMVNGALVACSTSAQTASPVAPATSSAAQPAPGIGNVNPANTAAFNAAVPSTLDLLNLFNDSLAENHVAFTDSLRGNKGLQAQGAPIGALRLYPTMGLSEKGDSNIYATSNREISDFYTELTPSVEIQSSPDIPEKLLFLASGDIRRYWSHGTEDVSNYAVSLVGQADVYDYNHLKAGASYNELHEDRGSPDAVNGLFPTEYQLATGSLGYEHEVGILGIRVDGTAQNYNYHNNLAGTGAIINETDRNFDEYAVTARVRYDNGAAFTPFLQLVGNERDYDHKFDLAGFQHSSSGYAAGAGLAYQDGDTRGQDITGEMFVGYIHQDYDDRRFGSVGGVGFAGNIFWNAVPKVRTFHATVSRTIEETAIQTSSSYIQTALGVGFDQVIGGGADWQISGNLGYARQDYQGIVRIDDNYNADLSLSYLFRVPIAAHLPASAGIDVGYSRRSSDIPGVSYDRATIAFNLRLQY